MKTLEVAWLIATDECPFNTEKGQAVAMLKAVLHVGPLLSENHWIRNRFPRSHATGELLQVKDGKQLHLHQC